jgi:hypothetical protein
MAAAIQNTVLDAMITCGVDNIAMLIGDTPAPRIAADIFDDTFTTCMDFTLQRN